MKQHFYFLWMLLLFCSNISGQNEEFDPSNPPEPDTQYNLNLRVSPNGAGSFSGAGRYVPGTSMYISAYSNTGFRFKSWQEDGNVVSTSSSFYYSMPEKNTTLTAVFEYDPNSPGEPVPAPDPVKYSLDIEAQPSSAGSFNVSSGNKYEEGTSVYLFAYTNTGFKFREWRDGEQVISTGRSFYYSMPSENKSLTAVYYYDPDAPSEPDTPTDIEHGLIAPSQSGEVGRQIAYPVYLLNHNIDIHSVEFDILFPENVLVDYQNSVLSSRINGHTLSITQTNDTQFHVSVDNEPGYPFFDSNGILLTMFVTLPSAWNPGETHPVAIRNVTLGTTSEDIVSTAKNGTLSVAGTTDYSVYASFYPTKFLNRVLFTNLSSETATVFHWNFGDGNTSIEREPLHVYDTSGNYEVLLKASGDRISDSTRINVYINPEDFWIVSGVLSLNKHKKEVKNFTSLDELFRTLSKTTLAGDITVQVEAGEIFEIPLSVIDSEYVAALKDKIRNSNHQFTFAKAGTGNNPVISITGNIGDDLGNMKDLFSVLALNEVDLQLFGIRINLSQLDQYEEQIVCSGDTSEVVDFSLISNGLNYSWSLAGTPQYVSGYQSSGTGNIPAMALTNTSSQRVILKYAVDIKLNTATLFELEYSISVLPALSGTLSNLFPENNEELSSTAVELSWDPVENAVYDLYLWEAGTTMPNVPFAAGLNTIRYSNISSYCQYGKSYSWKIVARNECKTIESDVFSFHLRKLPDLHVTQIDISEAFSGKPVTVEYTVKNNGQGATMESLWYDRIWLVTNMEDGTNSGYSKLLAEVPNLHSLDPDQSYTNSVEITLPEREVGLYYIIVATDMQYVIDINWDAAGTSSAPDTYLPDISGEPYPYLFAFCGRKNVTEKSDNNSRCDNFFYNRLDILTPPLPDLIVESIIVSPTNFFSGTTVNVTAKIKNAGTVPTPDIEWIDALSFSKGAIYGDSTIYTLTTKVLRQVLYPDSSYMVTFSASTPIDVFGECYFYVHANAGNNVYEHVFNNNNISRSDRVNVTLRPAADLIPTSLSTTPALLSTGAPFTVHAAIKNQGLVVTNVSNWADKIYISTNSANLDESAILLDNTSHTTLLYGTSDNVLTTNESYVQLQTEYKLSRMVNLPGMAAGTYYLYIHTDVNNEVFEYNAKDNNILRSQAVTVSNPDLSGEIISAVPDTIYTGKEYGISWKTTNSGNGAIANKNIADRIFLEKVSNPAESIDLIVTGYDIASLLKDEFLTKTGLITLNHQVEEGKYNMYVQVNATNTLFESDNTNNLSLVKEVVVKRSFLPDLAAVSATVPGSAEMNETIPVTLTISNQGTPDLNQHCQISVYISGHSSYSGSAIPCTVIPQPPTLAALAAGTSTDIEMKVVIPDNLLKGDMYLIFILDGNNRVEEINKSNNTFVEQLFINGRFTDLLVENIDVPETCMSGTPITVSWQVDNIGNIPPNSLWRDAIYVSSSNEFNAGNAVLLAEINYSAVQSFPYSNSQSITVPHRFHGEAYIYIVTDVYNATNDYDRSNNTNTASHPVSVTLSEVPDLRFGGINAFAQATIGQPYKIVYTVENSGIAALSPTRLTDVFYLSSSNVLNSTAIQIGEKSAQRNLDAGQYYTDSIEIVLPAGMSAGNYYLFGRTDVTNMVYETGKNNNIYSTSIVVKAPLPADLTVADIHYPASALIGEPVNLTWLVKNEGGNAAGGRTKDAVFLSLNETWDNSAVLIGSATVNLSLEPSASAMQTYEEELTGVPCGNYYVMVRTNATSAIPETDYENNTRVSLGKVSVDYPALEIDVAGNASLTAAKNYKYYKLVVDNTLENQTLLCELKCSQANISNGIYISHESVPNPAVSDYFGAEPDKGSQRITIPKLKQGTYYILVRNNDAMAGNVDVEVLASIINFSVIAVDKGKGANIGSVTVKVDGAKFDTIMDSRLQRGGEIIPTENAVFKDETRTFATFNLLNVPLGEYDMVAELPGGITTSLLKAYEVITGKPAELHTEFVAPASVRLGTKYTVTLDYGNTGDVDLNISDFLIISENGDPIALTSQELDSAYTEIRLPVGNNLGTPGILSPGSHDSRTIFIRSISPEVRLQLYVIRRAKR